MTLLPISLGVRRKPEAEGAVYKNRSKLKAMMEKALWRDDYTCRCCGFHAGRFQKVIPAGQDIGADEDFITVCLFCEESLTLEKTGLAGAGVLIWLPELSQSELNHVMRAIYVVREENHSLAAVARQVYDALMARRTEAKKRLGSDDPLLLATVLYESLSDAEYESRKTKLEGIRLLPLDRMIVRTRHGDVNQFADMVNYWRSGEGPFGKLPVDSWTALFDSVKAKTSSIN